MTCQRTSPFWSTYRHLTDEFWIRPRATNRHQGRSIVICGLLFRRRVAYLRLWKGALMSNATHQYLNGDSVVQRWLWCTCHIPTTTDPLSVILLWLCAAQIDSPSFSCTTSTRLMSTKSTSYRVAEELVVHVEIFRSLHDHWIASDYPAGVCLSWTCRQLQIVGCVFTVAVSYQIATTDVSIGSEYDHSFG
jgi:hypothetical protein